MNSEQNAKVVGAVVCMAVMSLDTCGLNKPVFYPNKSGWEELLRWTRSKNRVSWWRWLWVCSVGIYCSSARRYS